MIMKTINANTQRGQHFLYRYNNSRGKSVTDTYKKPSHAKVVAQNICLYKMAMDNGHDFRIMAAGCHAFTCGWQTPEGLRVETKDGSYLVKQC